MPFDPNKPFEVVSDPEDTSLVGRIERSSFDPNKPFDVVQPTKKKEAFGTGQFAFESQPLAALARGALESITGGLAPAITEELTGTSQFDPNSPEFQNPYLFATGEFLGGLVPLGKVAKGAEVLKKGAIPFLKTGLSKEAEKTLRKEQLRGVRREGARVGAAFGAASGLSEKIREKDIKDIELGEALESTLKGGAIGGTVGFAIPASAQAVSKLSNLRKTVDDRIADIAKVSSAKGAFVDKFNKGSFSTVVPDIAAKFKAGTGHVGLQEARESLLNESIDLIKPIVKGADPTSPLFDQTTMLSRIHQRASSEIPSEEARNRSINAVMRDYGDVNPENLTEYTGDIGKKLVALYASPDKGRFSDRIHALEAVRDVFSGSVKTILDQSNVDPAIWSRYGLINELGERIADNYGDEVSKLRQLRGEGIAGGRGVAESSLIPGVGAVKRSTKRAGDIMGGGEPERLDKQINEMFRKVKPQVPFTDEQRKALIKQAVDNRNTNIAKSQAAKSRAERGVEYKRVNETRAEYAKRLKQKRADFVAREGASPEELQQGGAAAITLSQMEKDFQSKIEADGLNKALMDVFPEVNKSERAIIERELQSATPKETRDIMSQLLNEAFQLEEQGAMTRISEEFDKVLRSVRKSRSSESLNLLPD